MIGLWVSLALAAPKPACTEALALPPPPAERGVALGLFSMDPDWSYSSLVDEIVEHGATHVSLVWVWWQDELRSTNIYNKPLWTATEAQLVETASIVKQRGLHLTVFPIVRLVKPGPGEWRGRIAPTDEDAWWASYDAYILRAAAIASFTGADRFSVGSELLTREAMRPRWQTLIERIRLRHPQLELMYSANWDHYRPVRFWDLLDVAGMTAYWELGDAEAPQVERLVTRWKGPRGEIERFSDLIDTPVVLTEIGYPSLKGGLRWPWNETRKAEVDLETQRLGYEAFARAFGGRASIAGAYFWNWFGFGGPEDGDYTPRGKPAADVMGCWYRGSDEPGGASPPRGRSR